MTAYRHKWTGKKVSVIEPLNDFNSSVGFCMVVNNKTGEILKFFKNGDVYAGIKYAKYKDLDFVDKIKYWWNYKRS